MINLNPFLALSRTPHLMLDLATPGLAALLCLGAFPPSRLLLLGLLTAFAGYTAVYALNDIIDYRIDCQTLEPDALPAAKPDLDAILVHHPLARGLLSLTVFFLAPVRPGWAYPAGALISGFYFLLIPWYRIYRSGGAGEAFHLFNRASYYPAAMLLVTILSWAA